MDTLSQAYTVTFTVNACITDIPFIEKTLRSMLRSFNYPFHERLVALDPGKPVGQYLDRQAGALDELKSILKRLRVDGLIDRVDEVPWDEGHYESLLRKYFSRDGIDLKDVKGAPIYQYLFALNQCTGDYIFHVDSDMLFYCDSQRAWIDDAIEMMQANPSVVFASCKNGPPQAQNFLEGLLGHPLRSQSKKLWHKASTVSTRNFLLDRKRLENHMLPLLQAKPTEPLENSFTHTLNVKGFERRAMNAGSWAIHPLYHDENFIQNLDDLIWAVENDVYPFKRTGKQWNMYTDEKNIKLWLATIYAARLAMSQ